MQKRNIVVMLILSFVTCGIYNIYWMYMAREEFRQYSGKDINPGLELLLNLLCFPFFYYWLFKFSSDIAEVQRAAGRQPSDTALVNLLLAIFGLGLVSELIIQTQLNELE